MGSGFSGYLNEVERFFCVVRRSGFLLSPKDCEKVRGWWVRGVPLVVVAEGILRGAREHRFKAGPGERLPHSLGWYGHFIAAQVRKFRAGSPGGGAGAGARPGAEGGAGGGARSRGEGPGAGCDPELVRGLDQVLAEARLCGLHEERALERQVKEGLVEKLIGLRARAASEGLSEEGLVQALRQLDGEVLALYHSRLPAERRGRLERQAADSVGGGGQGARALLAARERALRAQLREALGLPEWVA